MQKSQEKSRNSMFTSPSSNFFTFNSPLDKPNSLDLVVVKNAKRHSNKNVNSLRNVQ